MVAGWPRRGADRRRPRAVLAGVLVLAAAAVLPPTSAFEEGRPDGGPDVALPAGRTDAQRGVRTDRPPGTAERVRPDGRGPSPPSGVGGTVSSAGAVPWAGSAPTEGAAGTAVGTAPTPAAGLAVVGTLAAGGDDSCEVAPPPESTAAADELDADYYHQACWTGGVVILASAAVDGRALLAAARIVDGMLALRPDLRRQVERRGMKVAVLGRWERAVELPEYRDLPRRYPDGDWDAARAYSATVDRPLLTAPEENLACLAADTYPGQQVLVHELGHSVLDLAVRSADPGFWDRVVAAYHEALHRGRWVGYYGDTSPAEYWAEGVQAFFDAAARSGVPDPYGTPVGNRDELRAYDPRLWSLVREVFGDNPWRAPRCPAAS